ncbi:MAG: putative lipoprotein [Phycisphaerales bacterium]|nr:putative lipoprotein [Phycisphaerales bacterium]
MHRILSIGVFLCFAAVGCAPSYVVPGGPARLDALKDTDSYLRSAYEAKPLARFPATIAVARVQSGTYQSRTAQSYGEGAYRLITTRDVETDADFEKLGQLPGVAGVAPVNRMLVPEQLRTEDDLRLAAARVKADILLLYTFDTQFYVKDFAGPVSVVTLGLSPNRRAYVTTTASCILIDTRSGYVYGGAESTAKSDQIANGWTSDDAVDDTRRRTETESFGKLITALEKTWPGVVKQYSKPPTTQP